MATIRLGRNRETFGVQELLESLNVGTGRTKSEVPGELVTGCRASLSLQSRQLRLQLGDERQKFGDRLPMRCRRRGGRHDGQDRQKAHQCFLNIHF